MTASLTSFADIIRSCAYCLQLPATGFWAAKDVWDAFVRLIVLDYQSSYL